MISEIELTSPLPPDECIARLQAAIDHYSFRALVFGSKPVLGRVSLHSIHLRKRIDYQNSFQTVLSGWLEPDGSGTVFHGRTGMGLFIIVFMALLFSFLLLLGVLLFLATLIGANHVDNSLLIGVLLLLGLLAWGAGLIWFGRYLARGEDRFLIDFLAETLQVDRAKVTPQSQSVPAPGLKA
jgi:hypothetical protein